jgi:hypothetical protein
MDTVGSKVIQMMAVSVDLMQDVPMQSYMYEVPMEVFPENLRM